MKRKWLIGLLSILMVLAVCFGFAACGGEGGGNGQGGGTQTDQEIADAAIDTLKTLYKDGETASAYKVLGQTKVNGAMYDIVWTATSSDVTDISDYVQIGTMDETSKQITITIVKGDEPITYKLKATVTVNEASASMEVTKTIPAKPKDAKGTKDDPYSAARVIELANEMEPKTKFDESTDNPPRVYVQGYIVDVGTDQTSNGYNRVGYVYIVDNYSSDKDKNSSDALMILSINYNADGPLTCFADLEVGKKIMVAGYIMLYQKNSNAEPQPEITYFGNNGITCEYLEKPERTPQEKAQIALDSVKNAYYYNAVGDIELPKSSDSSVTLAWTSADDTYKVEDGKLKIEALPQSDKVIDLTVTATCENVPVSKTVKVTIKAAVTQPQGGILLTVDSLFPGNYSSAYADFNKDYTVGTHKVTTKQVMFSSDDSYLGAMQVQGSSSSHGSFTIEGQFVQVKITIRTSYTLVNPTVTEGSTSITGTADAGTADGKTTTNYDITKYVITYTLKGSGNVTITNPDTHAMYISSIELSEGEDTRNAQEKVNDALAAVQTEYNVTAAGNYTLPVSTEPDVTFSWSKKTGNYNVGSDGKSLEIGAELPAEATDVVLVLTATCGSETVTNNTKDVTFHISAKSAAVLTKHEGTLEDPFSVADAITLANTLANDAYYSKDGDPVQVAIAGYVSNAGKSYVKSDSEYYMSSVYIVDLADSKTALQIYTIDYNDIVTKPATKPENSYTPFTVGDYIVVYGYIKNFKGNTPEVDKATVGSDTIYPEVKTWEKVSVKGSHANPYTVAELKQLDIATSADGTEYYKVDDVITPVYVKGIITVAGSTQSYGIKQYWIADEADDTEKDIQLYSINWDYVKAGTNVKVGDTVVVYGYPQKYKGGDVQVSSWKDDENKYHNAFLKEYVPAEEEIPEAPTPGVHSADLDFTTNFETYAKNWSNSYAAKELELTDIGTADFYGKVTLSNASKQSSTIQDRPTMAANNQVETYVQLYAGGQKITSASFTLKKWSDKKKFSKIVIETSEDGKQWTEVAGTAVGDGTSNTIVITEAGDGQNNVFTYTNTTGATYVRLLISATGQSNVQVGLTSISLKINVPEA